MQEKELPSREGLDQDLPNSRPFGLIGRVPIGAMIGGGATIFGVAAAEVMGDSPWGVVVTGVLATTIVTSFNRTTLNDPIERPSQPPVAPEVEKITK
ncbi:MAG TPA: hypothetical protein VLG11_05575 [Candidatus Saccharimonadales bacterium]|nr:hypothetical protein [Candidatus Saccharimonadales bacterium]